MPGSTRGPGVLRMFIPPLQLHVRTGADTYLIPTQGIDVRIACLPVKYRQQDRPEYIPLFRSIGTFVNQRGVFA